MAAELLTDFEPDDERFAVLKECTDNYDVGEPDAEWPNNLLSRKTQEKTILYFEMTCPGDDTSAYSNLINQPGNTAKIARVTSNTITITIEGEQ